MQYSLDDLLSLSRPWPIDKSVRTELRRVTLSLQQRRVMFLAASHEPYSAPEGHIVSLFYPKAGRLDRLLRLGRLTPTNQICRVGCSCEAWAYWGAAYKSTQEGYRLPGENWREDRPADQRDPQGSYWACKHVLRVAQDLQGVSFGELQAAGTIPTAQHAQASLDSIRPVIAAYLVARDGLTAAEARKGTAVITPETAEPLMEWVGMLCPAE